jgi:hypothetical protein
MQPTTQPRLDRVQDFSQGLLGITFDSGLGWLVFSGVNCGQGFSFRGRSANLTRVKLPVGRFRVGDRSGDDQGWAESWTP